MTVPGEIADILQKSRFNKCFALQTSSTEQQVTFTINCDSKRPKKFSVILCLEFHLITLVARYIGDQLVINWLERTKITFLTYLLCIYH